jgi:hypothetical protein
MRKNIFINLIVALFLVGFLVSKLALVKADSTPEPTATLIPTPTPEVRVDITQKSQEAAGPLEALLQKQSLGPALPINPIKYAIRSAVSAGVPANTIVLLLLLPLIATIIAVARHVIGIRGFGIFLPAALAVVFVATGPIMGISLFLIIVFISTTTRLILRKLKSKLQYLPRMALILWTVSLGVLGVLFAAPLIPYKEITNVSIFAVLILALLAEDFTRVQLGKSIRTAISLTSETLLLSLISYFLLTLGPVQEFALLNPEIFLIIIFVSDLLLGRYAGLRFLEIWKFRKLIQA